LHLLIFNNASKYLDGHIAPLSLAAHVQDIHQGQPTTSHVDCQDQG